MSTIGTNPSLMSLGRPASFLAKVVAKPLPETTPAVDASPKDSAPPSPSAASPAPAPIGSPNATRGVMSLSGILTLQTSPPGARPVAAPNYASAAYKTSDESLDAPTVLTPAVPNIIHVALKETDMASAGANLQNVQTNRQSIVSSGQGLARQSAQAFTKVFA